MFSRRSVSAEEIAVASKKALVSLYSRSKKGDKFDESRLQKFCLKSRFQHFLRTASDIGPNIVSSAILQLQNLPPGAGIDLPSTDWGWRVAGSSLIPIMTDKDVAPKTLLEIIRYSCKTGHSTMKCSCRKAGLNCSLA